MSKTLLVAAVAMGGSIVPVVAVTAAPPQASVAQDQLEKDREFARKLRALKDRQHREWNELMDQQRAEVAALTDKTPDEQREVLKDHTEEKQEMKKRHQEELEDLKAEYQG
ncbi:hypothetical protein [Kordiimonas aestuarii]|uniref:hypothetical protein n=1 Tax=Kordiimonas aestuarii TaxID=1005925 RepID=UPI0021D315F0|nr:hypothetical protein [Kordiimonas aestuarii]